MRHDRFVRLASCLLFVFGLATMSGCAIGTGRYEQMLDTMAEATVHAFADPEAAASTLEPANRSGDDLVGRTYSLEGHQSGALRREDGEADDMSAFFNRLAELNQKAESLGFGIPSCGFHLPFQYRSASDNGESTSGELRWNYRLADGSHSAGGATGISPGRFVVYIVTYAHENNQNARFCWVWLVDRERHIVHLESKYLFSWPSAIELGQAELVFSPNR